MRALIVAALLLAGCGTAHGAVSQSDTLYACVTPDGRAVVRAYEPPCRRGQIVHWSVAP